MKVNKINSAVLCSEKSIIRTKNLGATVNDLPAESLTKTPPIIPITFWGRSNKYINELAILGSALILAFVLSFILSIACYNKTRPRNKN